MAWDFLAAAAGVASGAADAIEERNKELQRNADEEIKAAMKAANEQNTKMNTRRSELRDYADTIAEYSQGRLTKTQIAGILQTPAVAKDFAAKLQKAKRVEDVDFSAVYKLTGTQPTPEEEQDVIPRTIDRMTRAPKPTSEEPLPTYKGAFGLPTTAYSGAIASGERAAGMSLGQMRATARGVPELTEEERIKGKLDLSQFEDPESLTNIQRKLGDNMANGIAFGDPKNAKFVKQLQAAAVIKDAFGGDGEGSKPRTTSAINSVLDKSLRAGLDPFVVNRVVRFDPQTNDYVPITGDTKAIGEFMDHKNKLIQSQAKALGILDKDNKIVGGRNASDALLPYANIEEGKVVSWKSAVTPKAAETEAPAPAAPKVGAPSAVTAPADKDISIPAPAILTADGKGVDGTVMKKTYKPGQRVTMPNGKIKTWNGETLQ